MEVLYPCCGGLDIHKKSITACVLWAEAKGKSRKEKKRFGTFTHDLLQLADWLEQRRNPCGHGVHHRSVTGSRCGTFLRSGSRCCCLLRDNPPADYRLSLIWESRGPYPCSQKEAI